MEEKDKWGNVWVCIFLELFGGDIVCLLLLVEGGELRLILRLVGREIWGWCGGFMVGGDLFVFLLFVMVVVIVYCLID